MKFYDNEKNEYKWEIESTEEKTPEKKPKHRILKMTALFTAAAAAISGGSIGAYRYLYNDTANETIAADSESTAANETLQNIDNPDNSSAAYVSNTSSPDNSSYTVSQLAEMLLPSVVGIESVFAQSSNYSGFGFGTEGSSSSNEMSSTGTGIVYSSDGYIITNAHVIYDSEYTNSKAVKVTVVMNDKTEYEAQIVAYDKEADIAVLKADAENLTAAKFGDSSSVSVGDPVIAIGNPLGLDLFNTVTSGIISGLNRNITINDTEMNLIQTDAAINSGNSGGPLINDKGEVIGINSAKMSSSYSQTTIEGIGFAIPSDYALKVINDLISYGYVTGRAQIGISCQDITETISQSYNIPVGVYVTGVSEGSSAENAGIQQGDVITAVNGEEISSYKELNSIKNKFSSGDEITLTVSRNNQTIDIKITLGENKTIEQ